MNKPIRLKRSTFLCSSLLTAGFVLMPSLAVAEDDYRFDNVEKIVAVGDIHGAHPAFVGLLQSTGLIDAGESWTGGDTHFVSLGDILDRGTDSRKSMDLLMKLQTQATQAGGRVHVVAGNHELMNLMGDLRYVSSGEYAAFAQDETQAMRALAYQELIKTRRISQSDFDQTYPAGYFAHRAAFAPDGKYGRWLLKLPAIAVLNDTAFVHGGLPEMVAQDGLEKTNKTYGSALSEFMEARQSLIDQNLIPNDMSKDFKFLAKGLLANNRLKSAQKRKLKKFIELDENDSLNSEGPVWYRGAMMCRPVFEDKILTESLSKLNVDRVVVGHTPSPDGLVHTRYNGKLIQLDTGMLVSHYKGRPSALMIKGTDITVQYLDSTRTTSLSSDRTSPATQSDTDIENALETGLVEIVTPHSGDQPAKVKIKHLGKTFDGLFYAGNKERAAFLLDQQLGFDLVPPTAKRTIKSKTGSLQFRYAKAVNDTVRREENISIGGWCPLDRQYQLMLAFDVLTANSGRTGDNLYYRKNHGLIYLTDFEGGFGNEHNLPKGIRRDAIELSGGMREALAGLNQKDLSDVLGDILTAGEIKALLSRRDEMLKKFK